MSSGTASSLDAIGISSKQVQQDLANGTKNTFDIIQLVASKMKDFGADSQQVGDILKTSSVSRERLLVYSSSSS